MKQAIYQILSVTQHGFYIFTSLIRRTSVTAALVFLTLLFVLAGSVSAMLNKKPQSSQTTNPNHNNNTSIKTDLLPATNPGDNSHMTTLSNNDITDSNTSDDKAYESSTTVTVNGESITVAGDDTYERSYITEAVDGSKQVNISVQNHSSSEGGDTRSRIRERSYVDIRTDSDTR